MTDDVLVIVAVVISVIIFFELIVAIFLCIKFTKKRYGWFNWKCNKCCKTNVSKIYASIACLLNSHALNYMLLHL